MSFRELVALIVVVPLFLFLSALFPFVCVIFFGLWVCCLVFDVYSTYQFYRKEPDKFSENERNKLFSYLVGRVGFRCAVIIFPVLFEIPLLVFFAVLPLQILYIYMFPTAAVVALGGLFVCLATSFGASAVGHLQAAIKNTHINKQSSINRRVYEP